MKPIFATLLLALPIASAAMDSPRSTLVEDSSSHPFNISDLVMMDRVSDPQLSADARYAAFSVRSTDYAANKGINAIYVQDLTEPHGKPVKVVSSKASSPRWSSEGHSLYYIAPANGVSQLWRLDFHAGKHGLDLQAASAPTQVSHGPLDLDAYKLSPDGKSVLLSYAVFTDCNDLACTKERLDGRAKDKSTGTVYQKLFVRHWDTWADGRRSQLYIAHFGADGNLPAEPTLLSRGIDGDVPSKPFGDDSEFAFSPDGNTVYFSARIAGNSEPWSTNFDVYKVAADGNATPQNLTEANKAWDAYPVPSPDGKTLYYL
ncbi:MAG TPA: hypothetical protein VJP80_00790, partial [Candidatus Saccharimonadales bacterium]|nr:hypothetical protein [Candidatus Saccharimonadales bacterium]